MGLRELPSSAGVLAAVTATPRAIGPSVIGSNIFDIWVRQLFYVPPVNEYGFVVAMESELGFVIHVFKNKNRGYKFINL